MGHFDSHDKQLDDHFFNIECAGVVSRVSPDVDSLQVGDRVICLGFGHYGTFCRVKASVCHKIADEDDIEVMATMPIVFCSALHALKNLARIGKGQVRTFEFFLLSTR